MFSIIGHKCHPRLIKHVLLFSFQPQCRRRILSTLPAALENKVNGIIQRHKDLLSKLSKETDSSKLGSYGREISTLTSIVDLALERRALLEELETIEQLVASEEEEGGSGEDLFASDTVKIQRDIEVIDDRLTKRILDSDDPDAKLNAILEIRAGTGGEEASLFAGELLKSYEKYVQTKRWKWEILSSGNKTDLGGIREVSVSISANQSGNYDSDDDSLGVFGNMRYESGVHRVQRVPINDTRIHTSAVSVAILPDNTGALGDETAFSIPPADLKIETMRASGAGGQHVNTTESAVRITHLPTGISASIQDERSQHKNKAKAMKLITARVFSRMKDEENTKHGNLKAEVMGGGDRSERVRTYNFPQDRVTDHRCKFSEHGMENLIEGGLLVNTFLPHMEKLRMEVALQEMTDD